MIVKVTELGRYVVCLGLIRLIKPLTLIVSRCLILLGRPRRGATVTTMSVVQRRRNPRPANENGAVSSPVEEENEANQRDSDVEDADSKVTRLTLMEEVLLLGLKDKEV